MLRERDGSEENLKEKMKPVHLGPARTLFAPLFVPLARRSIQ
jgi:hypothetical protein